MLLLPVFLCAYAQDNAGNEMMYLVKGNRVISKFNVNEVDYVCFSLPDSLIDEAIWINIGETGKNHLSYTVNTDNDTRTYAHGIISLYEAEYIALDNFGKPLDELEKEDVVLVLKALLPYVAYLGIGSRTFEMTDWADDGTGSKFSVIPGTSYFVCAWEVEPTTQAPLDNFVFAETSTLAPGESKATLNVSFKRQNKEGLAFDIQGDDDILYVMTCFGEKTRMDSYVQDYGLDYLFGMFGQVFTIASLQGESEVDENIEAATWPISGEGEYILYVRGVDAQGDIVKVQCTATAEKEESEGPEIKILERSKETGKVSINFEISPKDVSEAYIRLMKENDLEDSLNQRHILHELATNGQNITESINNTGKYAYTNEKLEEAWYSILIYAKDQTGDMSTLRTNFWPEDDKDSHWADYPVVHQSPSKVLRSRMLSKSRKPTIERLK